MAYKLPITHAPTPYHLIAANLGTLREDLSKLVTEAYHFGSEGDGEIQRLAQMVLTLEGVQNAFKANGWIA